MAEKAEIPISDKLPVKTSPEERARLKKEYFQIKDKYEGIIKEAGGSIGEIRSQNPATGKWEVNTVTDAGKKTRRAIRDEFQKNRDLENALTDPLTGCDTRRMYDKRLSEITAAQIRQRVAIAEGKIKDTIYARKRAKAVIMVIDLPDLSAINNKYGHRAGDVVLSAVGSRLIRNTKHKDAKIRYGGDEFVLLLPEMDDKDVDGVAIRLDKALGEVSLPQYGLGDGIQINKGFAMLDPLHPERSFELADRAMYKAKKTFKDSGRTNNPLESGDKLTPQELAVSDYKNYQKAA